MIYLERKPSPALTGCVETLWYACAPQVPHQRELVLPGGKIQFVISLAADHLTDCGPKGDLSIAPALLVGARTSAELVATGDMKRLVGVVFRPGGLGPWLRERADLFFEQSLSLNDLWPMARERLREPAQSPAVTLQCWTRCFVSRLRRGNGEPMLRERLACFVLVALERRHASLVSVSDACTRSSARMLAFLPSSGAGYDGFSARCALCTRARNAMGRAGSQLRICGPITLLA